MDYLKKYLIRKKGKLAITLVMLLGQTAGTLLIPFLIAGIVDKGILQGDMEVIIKIGIGMVAVSIVATVMAVIGCYFTGDLAAGLGCDMREAVFKKSQDLSIREFDELGVSSMITRSTSDISIIQMTFGMIVQMIIPAPLMIGASIIMTGMANPSLTWVLFACILFFLIIALIIFKKSDPLSRNIQVKMDRINKVVRESITGIRVIRAFDNRKYEEDRSNDVFEKYACNMIKLNKLFAVLNPCVWLAMGLAMAAIVWFGGYFSLKGTMEIGEITAVTEYAVMTLGYLILATMSCVTLPKMGACLRRMQEVLEIEPEITDQIEVSNVIPFAGKNPPALEFENVTFYYHGAEEPVIKDLSFRCMAGQTTAIIGGTGSGKSTVANLLMRLYDIDEGHIRLKGIDIRDMTQEELRENIGYVPQKAFLFSGTIAHNLKMGNQEATKEDMEKALRIAQAESFVNSLPKGLGSPVSQGGSNFSGGQKQRLSIARAIVKNAPVLVFDDSFSALDLKTDGALRKALKKEVTGTVKLIIAQRISTIIDADQIIVLDDGRIAGIGDHETLLEECTVYQAIANSQLALKEAE